MKEAVSSRDVANNVPPTVSSTKYRVSHNTRTQVHNPIDNLPVDDDDFQNK